MARRPLSLWVYVAVGAAMLAAYLFASVRKVGGDPRPLGSAADIETLAERSELNLLLILIDTLRAHRLGAYGYDRDTSPNLDYLAQTGVRFAHNVAQSSWTKTSMASLWTGLYPKRTQVLRYSDAVAPQARMPAEILKEAGFRTTAIWRNGWVAPNFGFDQGFDAYHNPRVTPIPPQVRRENPSQIIGGTDYDTILSALEFVRSFADQRWFAYIHLMDVHQYVYDRDSALFGTSYSDIYDNSVRHTDDLIGDLLAGMREVGVLDKTLIVVASDHGEAFGEHGLEGHARNLYGEVTETPLILSFPFRLEPGLVVVTPSQNVDLWPTLLDLLGLPGLEDADGRSRVDAVLRAARGEDIPDGSRARFAQLDRTWGRTNTEPRPLVAVTQDSHRLVYDFETGETELYDLSLDPREQVDVSEEKPGVRERLRRSLDLYMDGPGPPWEGGAPQVELDEMDLKQLRALGYKIE